MKEFNKLIQAQLLKMCQAGKLFRVEMTGDKIWDLYLSSFVNDPVFRDPASSLHNCNNCKNFIRRYGNIVSVDENGEIDCLFNLKFNEVDSEFIDVAANLTEAITSSKIKDVFFETFDELNSLPYESCSKTNSVFRLGIAKNIKRYTKEETEKFGVVKENETRAFDHMHLDLPKAFVDLSGNSVESLMGNYRDSKNVFQRAVEEISVDTLKLVKDLINQGSLLDGTTHLHKIEKFIPLKEEYDGIPASQKDNWCWVKSYGLNIAKFRNELIGVLCSELSQGEELNKACESWNKRVDPANYMKASAPITKKQIEEAKKFVEENGYIESFNRRFATMEDIKVSEILHSNVGNGQMKTVSIFDGVKSTYSRHKRSEFDNVEEVPIDKFMKDILPGCSSVEVFLQSNHSGNMVTLTTAETQESKPIFKWSNNYSWTFNGNLAGKSQIKEAVKTAGGKIDGVLRFSIMWNEDGKDILDFDAHAQEPKGRHIYFGEFKRYATPSSGMLDVDMIRPMKMGVENIVWNTLSKMKDGIYQFWIHNYDGGSNHGFKAEIEFNGETYSYEHNTPVSKDVNIAQVTLKNGQFSINHLIPESSVSSKDIYGLETNQFHKVNLICLSPNHWNDKVGNKHYLFMLEGCKSPVSIRGFHNENLLPELLEHRKVLEVLGATHMIEPKDEQLSGLGYNSTIKDEVVLKLSGSHRRVIRVKF